MTDDLTQFRKETRAWLQSNCPLQMREPQTDEDLYWGGRDGAFANSAQKQWFEAMLSRGWTTPDWPTEYGGGGLDPERAKILREEMSRINARPPLSSFGIWMLGPALLKYGTEEQKRYHLPPIIRGEIRWCQGYSEPGAGSDLASVATRAEDKGDHWVVNGQKIWTSYANKADWIFCLVRTDPTAPKHLGISFVLFDMRTPGVSTRPIRLISGNSPFCETFFDDVVVPKGNLVGTLHRGWDVAKYLLGHEREMISAMGLGEVESITTGISEIDPLLRSQMALFDVRAAAFRACSELFLDEFRAGRAHPAKSSMMKYVGTELNKARHELLMSAGGFEAARWSGGSDAGASAQAWLRSKGNSIEGGTSEVQLNIVAKRILSLPST
ncbi:acyl-CoA dehydrogenase family protein [Novosphingobium sp. HII-3]|uniref:acyl-CoA dehydrogenase family protein n=1 Tax=Novosphingobium sp. HII-3 TaxID=2075565 RepID=UPI000CDB098B|nr:acyl-CoA dehydrogenase family protein [Novosphingobium sp. HII-3]